MHDRLRAVLLPDDVEDLPVLDSLAELLEPRARDRRVAARIDEDIVPVALVVRVKRVRARVVVRHRLTAEEPGDAFERGPCREHPWSRGSLDGRKAGRRVRARLVRVRPDLLAPLARLVDVAE